MIIEGQFLPLGSVAHMTDVDGTPRTLDMGDPAIAKAVLDSLQGYVAAVKPPLLKEHKRDGYRRGEVLEVFEGDADGVPGIFARVRVDDPEMQANAALIKRFSPFLVTNTTTSAGTVYPYGLHELSTVSVPMIDDGTPDIRIAAASQIGALRDDSGCAILAQSSETGAILAQAVEPMMTAAEIIAALQGATPEELAAFRAVCAPAPVAPPVVVESAAPPAAPAAPSVDPMMVAASRMEAAATRLEKAMALAPSSEPGSVAIAAGRGVAGGIAPVPEAKHIVTRAREIQREKNIPLRDAIALAGRE